MTTPSQPESKTPITDNARFSATTEHPESGDYELDVVQAEVAEKLETELATAQQRNKELEADGRRLDWLETRPILPLDCSVRPGIEPEFERSGITRASIDAAMSREQKEGEAK